MTQKPTLTREQIDKVRRDAVHYRSILAANLGVATGNEFPASVKALCDMALAYLDMVPVEWHGADTPPPVAEGQIGYFLAVTEKSKTAFGVHYLNRHLLNPEDGCPDATKENNWTSCKWCESGDGHPFTGWHEEKEVGGEGDFYYPMDTDGPLRVVMWAKPPVNPLSALPTPEGET